MYSEDSNRSMATSVSEVAVNLDVISCGALATGVTGCTMWAVAPRQMEQCPLPSSPPALSTWAANEVQANRNTTDNTSARHFSVFDLDMACTCISED
jgi:hypothetical protein